jgi:hypothetical protein
MPVPAVPGPKAAAFQFSADLAGAVALTTKSLDQLDASLLRWRFQQSYAIVGHRACSDCLYADNPQRKCRLTGESNAAETCH